MADCTRCGSRAQNAFICTRCEKHARKLLLEMPWWLDRLTEAAVGQTRMSDNAGRKSARRTDLDGEKPLAECIEQLPNEDDLDKARKARENHALAVALAAGGVNARASQLLSEVADSLAYWVRVVCETAGKPVPQFPAGRSLGAPQAIWLAVHVNSIAAHQDAADIVGDIETHREDIERTVNRPIRMIFIGPCPTWDDQSNSECGVRLRAPEDHLEVHCPRCKKTHNCHRLQLDRMADAERRHLTYAQVLHVNRDQPTRWRIPVRTLQHWIATGRLAPCATDGEAPLYSWADVKRLQLRRPQKAATGAAARRLSRVQGVTRSV